MYPQPPIAHPTTVANGTGAPVPSALEAPFWVSTDDWHTAGEPFRIIAELPPHCETAGLTVADRRWNIMAQPGHPVDTLRKSLCQEPRGHADMYGGFIVPPDDDGAHFGVLFFHKDGFSTACGHGTIALGCWAVQTGRVKAVEDGKTDVVIDVPSGRVVAQVCTVGGKVVHVDFINVPSYQWATKVPVSLSSPALDFTVEISWGGASYAFVDVKTFGLRIEPANHDAFVALGRAIKAALGTRGRHLNHDLYAVCFYDELDEDPARGRLTQRNVVVFADGQIDRSPCGSGTAARVALLLAQGRLQPGKTLVHRSIINTEFTAVVEAEAASPTEFPACIPRITGMAHLMGRHEFYVDPADPTFPGFVFR